MKQQIIFCVKPAGIAFVPREADKGMTHCLYLCEVGHVAYSAEVDAFKASWQATIALTLVHFRTARSLLLSKSTVF